MDVAIANDVSKFPSQYYDLLSLKARAALSSLEITVSPNSDGNGWNTSDMLAFMKDIGGEDLIRFVTEEYASKAQEVFEHQLHSPKLTMANVWDIFHEMLPMM